MSAFKNPQVKLVTGFLSDMSKGLMLGAIIGQWSIPDLEIGKRIFISINWYILALFSLGLALYLAKYEQ